MEMEAKTSDEVVQCAEWLVAEVVRRSKENRRVSFAADTKTQDGISRDRKRVLLKWYKSNVRSNWRRGFNYYSLTPSQIHFLKQDTKNLIYRLYAHPHRRITLLSDATGGTLPMITESYLTFFMISEIDYLHTAFR